MNHIDTMSLVEAAKLALEALESIDVDHRSSSGWALEVSFDEPKCEAAIAALRLAIEQAEKQEPDPCKEGTCDCCWTHLDEQAEKQEPVAWRYKGKLHEFDPSDWASPEFPITPLYTAPPPQRSEDATQRQPLIPEALQVIDDLYDWRTTEGRMMAYRAIERAHKIGGDK